MQLRLRDFRLLQELPGAAALLGAAAEGKERRGDDNDREPDHDAGIGSG